MRKFTGFFMILAVLILAKLSYDAYQLSQRFDLLQQQIVQVDKKNANLNDVLVSLQRQISQTNRPIAKPSNENATSEIKVGINPTLIVKQQLELVQFALQQHQYVYAIDKLNLLNERLPSYELAPALQQGLHDGLIKDQQIIQQFIVSKNQQQQIFDDLIQSIDQDLQNAQQNSQLKLQRQEKQHFWQGWFQLEPVERMPADLVNRRIILKEVQLRLLLAAQAINNGHLTEYQQVLLMATEQLIQLPDAASQNLKKKLDKLKQLPILPVPKLITLGLLG